MQSVLTELKALRECHFQNPVFSLRSVRDGVDVSAIAKANGGGGHTRAAGFSVGCHDPLMAWARALGRVGVQG